MLRNNIYKLNWQGMHAVIDILVDRNADTEYV